MIWLDAHLSPRIAKWIDEQFEESAKPLRELGLRDAEDSEIFAQARAANVIVMTKDRDFPDIVTRLGSPPKVIWLRCGNTSEAKLKVILAQHLATALTLLENGEDIVEIR